MELRSNTDKHNTERELEDYFFLRKKRHQNRRTFFSFSLVIIVIITIIIVVASVVVVVFVATSTTSPSTLHFSSPALERISDTPHPTHAHQHASLGTFYPCFSPPPGPDAADATLSSRNAKLCSTRIAHQ